MKNNRKSSLIFYLIFIFLLIHVAIAENLTSDCQGANISNNSDEIKKQSKESFFNSKSNVSKPEDEVKRVYSSLEKKQTSEVTATGKETGKKKNSNHGDGTLKF